jgi:hypothetical protein
VVVHVEEDQAVGEEVKDSVVDSVLEEVIAVTVEAEVGEDVHVAVEEVADVVSNKKFITLLGAILKNLYFDRWQGRC